MFKENWGGQLPPEQKLEQPRPTNQEKPEWSREIHEQKVHDYLVANELILDTDRGMEVNADKIKNFAAATSSESNRYNYNGQTYWFTNADFFEFFKDKYGYDKTIDVEAETKLQPVVSLPSDLAAARQAKFSAGLLKPWEITVRPDFRHPIKLADNSEMGMADLYYLDKIKELELHRDEAGDLVYRDKITKEFKKFSSWRGKEIFGELVNFKEQGENYSFRDKPLLFIQKFLPQVSTLGLFQTEDFRRNPGSLQSSMVFTHERKISGRHNYIHISGEGGPVSYYVGRQKIVGTDQEITESMRAIELDKEMVGITEEAFGRRKLLYTFDKLTQKELGQLGLAEKVQDRLVNAEEMKKRIKDYKLSEYLPRRAGETPEHYANRLSDLNDMTLVTRTFRDFAVKAAVPLSELSWTEQLQVANYTLENKDNGRLLGFVKSYGLDGLRSFLTVEADSAAAEKIIKIGEQLPADQAKMVFAKVSSFNSLAIKSIKDLALEFFNDPAGQEQLLADVHSSLLKKSSEIVSGFYDRLRRAGQVENLLKDLERQQTEILMLFSVLKKAKQQDKKINWEIINDLDLQVKDYGQEMPATDKTEIKSMANANWQGFGNARMADVVLDGLDQALAYTKNQKTYILKYKDEVIGFVRFEPTDHDTVLAGSFNVSKDLRGLSIGNEMMEKALMKEGESHVLEASASIKIPAGCTYIEKIGFVADGLIENYHGTGESLFSIKLDQANNQKYWLRHEGKNRPTTAAALKLACDDYRQLDNLVGRPYIVLRFDLRTEMAEYQKTLSRLLPKADDDLKLLEDQKDKYTLTRYFYDKAEDPQGNIRYLALEKN